MGQPCSAGGGGGVTKVRCGLATVLQQRPPSQGLHRVLCSVHVRTKALVYKCALFASATVLAGVRALPLATDVGPVRPSGGGGGMTPGCIAVCSGRRLLASRHLPLSFPFLEPSPSAGGDAHRPPTPSCPPSPCLAYPYFPTHPSFPLGGCANGAPGLSLFHCFVRGPHGGGALPSPLPRCVRGWGVGGGRGKKAAHTCGGCRPHRTPRTRSRRQNSNHGACASWSCLCLWTCAPYALFGGMSILNCPESTAGKVTCVVTNAICVAESVELQTIERRWCWEVASLGKSPV